MEVNNIKKLKPGFYTYMTDEFATVKVKFSFKIGDSFDEYLKTLILVFYLTRTNKLYKTRKEINDRCKELYGLEFSAFRENIGKINLLSFSMKMVSPVLVKDNYFKDACIFYKNMILEPNFKDNKLDTEVLSEIKKEILNNNTNILKNPANLQFKLFEKYASPTSTLNNYNILDLDYLKEFLDNLSDKDIISFYNNAISNYYGGYSFGNITLDDNNLLCDIFPFEGNNILDNYEIIDEITNGSDEIVSNETSQSYLYVVYRIKNFDFKKVHLYRAISTILNSGTGLCLKVLREKLGIVYAASTTTLIRRGFMYFRADIDKKNKELCLNGIDEIMTMLSNEEIISEKLKFVKDIAYEAYIQNLESVEANISEVEDYIFR